jgi:transcriptional regulator with XRE-family HTH domain
LGNKKTITFGKTLGKLRRRLLLSQEELAEFSQRDRKTISDLERDEYLPTLETIFNLSVALNLKPSELLKEMEGTEENAKYLLEASKEVEELKTIHKNKRNSQKDA